MRTTTVRDSTKQACIYYKYFWQYHQNKRAILAPEQITAAMLLNNPKTAKYFDKLGELADKYGFDLYEYFKFIDSGNLPGWNYRLGYSNQANVKNVITVDLLKKFAAHIQEMTEYKKIYNTYNESCKKIADRCIELNVNSATYFKFLIENNLLAQAYITGQISKYVLASFKNLPQLVRNMDSISRDTLSPILSQHDLLLDKLQKSAFYMTNMTVCTTKIIDNIIIKNAYN